MNADDQGGTSRAYLFRVVLWLALFIVGCHQQFAVTAPDAPKPLDGKATISVAIHPGFRTQTLAADVHHYAIRLYDWDGSNLGAFRAEHTLTSGTLAHFTNVPPGQYKVMVEAFATTADAGSITRGGARVSDGWVTVTDGAPPNYSSGPPLTVTVPLVNQPPLLPGDAGNPTLHHDFSVAGPTVANAFVWVPQFVAYQLKVPTSCGNRMRFGVADSARPVGYWVGSRPEAGQPDVDWVATTLGGFYVAKYEASRYDATSADPGSGDELAVQANVIPWATVAWAEAARACTRFHPKGKLMGSEEWLALAVWAMIHDVTVHGNNDGGVDVDWGTTFTVDPANVDGRALTGSGVNAGWTGSTNLTSHTGTTDGVYDLNGNVAEWMLDLAGGSGATWLVHEVATGVAQPASNRIAALSVDNLLRLYGVPSTVSPLGVQEFGGDGFVSGSGAAVRGGTCQHQSQAGLWFLDAAVLPTTQTPTIGFRPVLR